MNNLIMGVDPGRTTGVCLIQEQERDFWVVTSWQIPWEQRVTFFVALFSGAFADPNGVILLPEIVVIESFRLRPGRAMEQIGSEFPSVRVIGIVETLAEIVPQLIALQTLIPAMTAKMVKKPLLVYQEPSIISRVEILPEHKEELSGLIHAQDAYRHARYYHLTTRSR